MGNERLKPKSTVKNPGPRSEFQPALPNAPTAFGANAAGFSHARECKSLTYGSPTTLGRSAPSPVRELSCPALGLNGIPLRAEMMGESCQSPSNTFAHLFANLGLTATSELTKMWRTSYSQEP